MLLLLLFCGLVTAEFDAELHDKYERLHQEDFMQFFNQQNFTWQIGHNDLKDMHTGCVNLVHRNHRRSFPIKTHSQETLENLPENFDSREKWTQCESIKDIYVQGSCGSCWTFGTATTASDRTCIHSNVKVRLSEQDLVCCHDCFKKGTVCEGGDPHHAFQYWKDQGLVTQECKPYDIEELSTGACEKQCHGNKTYGKNKYFAEKVYIVNGTEDNIRAELFHNGPLETHFDVYKDFKKYKTGIYEHKYGEFTNRHSVRVIGYGVENGVKYWLAANSWGAGWGENGFFRIKRYLGIGFEDDMTTGLPKM